MATGGTPFNQRPKRGYPQGRGQVQAGGLVRPPVYASDPAIEAQRGAAQRGLGDTLKGLHVERRQGRQDLNQALRDVQTKSKRGAADTNLSFSRGTQKLGFQQQDTQLHADRANADFSTKLTDISRQFMELGARQKQQANAAGVLDSGTQAASAAARTQNQERAVAPIHTAQGRLSTDLASALGRIGIAGNQLSQDRTMALGRLGADTHRDTRLSKQSFGRLKAAEFVKAQIARREAAISNVELLKQEIFQARGAHPGLFAKTGAKVGARRH
jgi:hypothetical protein